MKLKITIIVFLLCLFFSCPFTAAEKKFYPRSTLERVVGTIQKIERNILSIYDEHDKTLKRLVYVNNRGEFKAGDRVSIFYQKKGNLIESVKKMTAVDYKEDSQNLGYLFKKKEAPAVSP